MLVMDIYEEREMSPYIFVHPVQLHHARAYDYLVHTSHWALGSRAQLI